MFKSTLLALSALILISFTLTAQTPAPAPAQAEAKPVEASKEAPKTVPAKVPDALKPLAADIQIVALKRALSQRDYQLGVQQLSKLQQDFNDQSAQFNAKTDDLYQKLGIKKDEFDINFETGDITPIPPQKK